MNNNNEFGFPGFYDEEAAKNDAIRHKKMRELGIICVFGDKQYEYSELEKEALKYIDNLKEVPKELANKLKEQNAEKIKEQEKRKPISNTTLK